MEIVLHGKDIKAIQNSYIYTRRNESLSSKDGTNRIIT